ncbi:App1 family protein [Olivibacter ginsenosidimutans]|uniref:App1 family protein n=1 Tax=Olivibacter ginsenosidimutans TaxID=1176537 RepID=A0ABP9BSK1_9SPHI
METAVTIKIYNGYGHRKNLVIYGHVLKGKQRNESMEWNTNGWRYTFRILRLFLLRPLGKAHLRLFFRDQIVDTIAEADGFFKFKWTSVSHLDAGLHPIRIGLVNQHNNVVCMTKGHVYVPHTTQYVFVSDIDDTVLISHSATVWKRLRELLVKNIYQRQLFTDNVYWYQLLSLSDTKQECSNPFFYVSSSEWNLYDYLHDIFKYNQLPSGSFLLSHFKRWFDFFKTGRTDHNDKYRRISRLLRVFPKQKFVLIGDNSQRDPMIYAALATNYPNRIKAIYIRNIKKKRATKTLQLLESMSDTEISICLFNTNNDAINHSKAIGLIS